MPDSIRNIRWWHHALVYASKPSPFKEWSVLTSLLTLTKHPGSGQQGCIGTSCHSPIWLMPDDNPCCSHCWGPGGLSPALSSCRQGLHRRVVALDIAKRVRGFAAMVSQHLSDRAAHWSIVSCSENPPVRSAGQGISPAGKPQFDSLRNPIVHLPFYVSRAMFKPDR